MPQGSITSAIQELGHAVLPLLWCHATGYTPSGAPRTFACSVSDHCESGQIVAVYTDVRPGGVEQSSGAGRGAAGLLVLAAALVQALCVV